MYNKEIKLSRSLANGYNYFCDVDHPLSNKDGLVYYHRHIVSLNSGRWLRSDEQVHHIDENKQNNNINNLMICTRSEHAKLHSPEPEVYFCKNCGTETHNKHYCSDKCSRIGSRVVERPSRNELVDLIENNSLCAIGRMYSVSDNAIRKWAISYELI